MSNMWFERAPVEPLLYQQVRDEHLADDIPETGDVGSATEMLPAVPTDDLTRYDHLAERTDNGLRPDDLAFAQPPQDPEWRPDGDR